MPVTGVKCCIPARRATPRSPPAPTRPRIAVAAALSEWVIIGLSSARSDPLSGRCRTDGWLRYATSSIGFSRLADG